MKKEILVYAFASDAEGRSSKMIRDKYVKQFGIDFNNVYIDERKDKYTKANKLEDLIKELNRQTRKKHSQQQCYETMQNDVKKGYRYKAIIIDKKEDILFDYYLAKKLLNAIARRNLRLICGREIVPYSRDKLQTMKEIYDKHLEARKNNSSFQNYCTFHEYEMLLITNKEREAIHHYANEIKMTLKIGGIEYLPKRVTLNYGKTNLTITESSNEKRLEKIIKALEQKHNYRNTYSNQISRLYEFAEDLRSNPTDEKLDTLEKRISIMNKDHLTKIPNLPKNNKV